MPTPLHLNNSNLPDTNPAPSWMRLCLRFAAIYNIAWGAWAILAPNHFWSLLKMDLPNYPFLWQCIGMIVGVYGVGYWIAGNNPYRHWPIVLVGLLGKILGPIGFFDAHFLRDLVPLRFGITLLTNDFVWWVPFFIILFRAYQHHEFIRRNTLTRDANSSQPSPALTSALKHATTNFGTSLFDLSRESPLLVVFLRHAGCTFCREALADIAAKRATIESQGVRILLVHMGTDAQGQSTFTHFGVADLPRISDPDRTLYRAFDLSRGSLSQLFGPRVLLRGLRAGIIDRHFVGTLQGDGLQMPGAFLIHNGIIQRAFRHADAADRPDYCELAAPTIAPTTA